MDNDPIHSSYPAWLDATLASDATEGRGVLPAWIEALAPDSRAVGPAYTVLACEDDNQALRVALSGPLPKSCVIVVAGHSTSRTATLGGLMALELQQAGVAGLVTDGLVRDSREIRRLGFPVWCRGTSPTASGKRHSGVLGGAVTIGGTLLREGDLVIADDDGVVIWPREDFDDLVARAQARFESDNARLSRLLSSVKVSGDGT